MSFAVKVLIFRITFLDEDTDVLSVSSIALSCKDRASCPRCDAPVASEELTEGMELEK